MAFFKKKTISEKVIGKILEDYDQLDITIGCLGGHSALDICRGAKKMGFKTLVVAQKGREKTYSQYYKYRDDKGCVDETIVLSKFSDILKSSVQDDLRSRNVIFIHNRYFWVYFDFKDIETKFKVPIYGSRTLLKLEERDVDKNQYYLLEKSRIRIPKIFNDPKKIDRLVIVKVNEAQRKYERAFFLASKYDDYLKKSEELIKKKVILKEDLKKAVIEEYILGAHVNFNFFYSPLTSELELMGTDTRRQTNLDGFLRLPASEQLEIMKHVKPSMIETGHIGVTVKESLLEKAFSAGERFVEAVRKQCKQDLIGPFALQGAIVAEKGKEELVVFDVSLRIPGSPGTLFTPYSGYLYLDSISYGDRIAKEIRHALDDSKLGMILT